MKVFVIFLLLVGVAVAAEENYEYLLKGYTQQWNQTLKAMRDRMPRDSELIRELSKLRLPTTFENVLLPRQENALCGVCRASITTLLTMRRIGASVTALRNFVFGLCSGFNVVPDYVCEGVIDLNIEIILFIVDAHRQLSADTICGIVAQPLGCNINMNAPGLEWSIDIDPNGEEITEPKSEIPDASDDDLVIVHITDTHYDPHYREGAKAVCVDPVCCRLSQGMAELPENGAGRWGDYRDCDSPYEAILDVFERIKANHKKIDLIYFTGDIVDHGVWETSFLGNVHSISRTFGGLKKVFGDIPLYPIIANHENHPSNQFAPRNINQPNFSASRLYELLADTWDWLPDNARNTIRDVGYYSVLVRKGLRVIGMNDNDGYTFNWWLLYDTSYARKQLQWLHDTLLEAERNNEKVHILAHIPSGNGDCFRTWSREFNRIVNRFWRIISAQFNGHTHRDQFYVYYSHSNPMHAINVAWNGGSATPYAHVNANYRLYSVEPETYQVVDHDTWIFNLTTANANRDYVPDWFKEYSFKEAYGVRNLSPAALDDLATNLATDVDMLTDYWKRTVKHGDSALSRGCDKTCLAHHLCGIVTAEFGLADNVRCRQLQEKFWKHVN